MIFGILNPEKIDMKILQVCPPHPSDLPTLPWEIQKKSFSTVLFIHTSDYLCYLRRKPTVILLPTTLSCELQNIFIWLKICCILSSVGGSEKSRLWCVATGMSGKQCRSKCSKWPPSALTHASSHFDTDQSHRTPRCAEIQPTSQQTALASLNMSISIHALL